MHEKVHDGYSAEKCKDVIISCGMPVFSHTLGVRGVCNIVELHKDKNGVTIFGREGLFLPIPIEYKRGKPKESEGDVLQLTAQAICLEEMLLCDIAEGYLFYGEINHRTKVIFDHAISQEVIDVFKEMHEMYDRRHTPKVKTGKFCGACSLADICLLKPCKNKSDLQYSQSHLEEDKL